MSWQIKYFPNTQVHLKKYYVVQVKMCIDRPPTLDQFITMQVNVVVDMLTV